MSSSKLKPLYLVDSNWRESWAADTAKFWKNKLSSYEEKVPIMIMHRGFMAAEEYGRLNDHPRRKILTEIYEDMAGGYFRFEEIDQEQVVRHTLPSEIFAELDARKAARLRVSAAVAIATVVEPQLYEFEEVLFDSIADDESEDLDETVGSPTLSFLGTTTPPTELSEEDNESEGKDAPASDETEEPIGLGLTLPNEEQVLELSIDAELASASAVGLGITPVEDARAIDKKKLERSKHIEDCTVLDAASANKILLDTTPGAPRFNRHTFEGYAVPEAATTPPAPQPNTFTFELSPLGRVSVSASSSSLTLTSLGTITPPTEVSDDKCESEGAPVSGAIWTPIGLGLAFLDEEQMFGCSTYTEARTVLGAGSVHTSTLDMAPGTPRFNTFAFEECFVPEAVPSDRSTVTPATPQPNTFVFEHSSSGRVLPQSPSPASSSHTTSSVSSSSGSDEYMRRAAALFAGHLPLLMYSMHSHRAIFTSAVNLVSVTADTKSASIWSLAYKVFSGVSAAALRNESFSANFVERFENEGFRA
ncbi:hypothetical protein FIBSPDRAFT_1041293 [Athelia psychrophila]|uniref:Uncharacterized protein n=1 Tax=Athelia psychrophila TaxID=1759441 RepID=A0A166P3W6_9AGAM|nr:hypothetical protein FIBSPDRAFT_1041293 [Fibularhizoctonia sp. CBS 109695]